MSNFKNIEKLGLRVHNLVGQYLVSAENLELVLQSAQVVYGNDSNESVWFNTPSTKGSDTHSALLIGITPLKKKTKAEAALELLSKITNDGFHLPNNADIIEQAKRILEMKDEVK